MFVQEEDRTCQNTTETGLPEASSTTIERRGERRIATKSICYREYKCGQNVLAVQPRRPRQFYD